MLNMKVEKLLGILSAYNKEEENFHASKCWKGHKKMSCVFSLFSRLTWCVLFWKAHTKNKSLRKSPYRICSPSLFFLWGLNCICEFWYFVVWFLTFMTREGTMSKREMAQYSSFAENRGHMNALGWLGAPFLVLLCLWKHLVGKTK